MLIKGIGENWEIETTVIIGTICHISYPMLDIDLKIFHLLSKINPVAITLDDCNYSLFKLGYDF